MIREPYIGMPIVMNGWNKPENSYVKPESGCINCSPAQCDTGEFESMLLGSLPIAMAYVPMQQWKTTYSPSVALQYGTVFPELNLPFEGGSKK